MIAFEVSINGEFIQTFAIGEGGSLASHLFWMRNAEATELPSIELSTSGCYSKTNEWVRWPSIHPKSGDEVIIRLVEVESLTGTAPTPAVNRRTEPIEEATKCPRCGGNRVTVIRSSIDTDKQLADIYSGNTILGGGKGMPDRVCLTCTPDWRQVHELTLRDLQLGILKERAVGNGEFTEAANCRDQQYALRVERDSLITRFVRSSLI